MRHSSHLRHQRDDTILAVCQDALPELGHEPVAKHIAESGTQTIRDVQAEMHEDDYGLRITEEVRSEPQLSDSPIVLCTGATLSLRKRRVPGCLAM